MQKGLKQDRDGGASPTEGSRCQRAPYAIAMLCLLLGACGGDDSVIAYVCDEPLGDYLEQARENIANDYQVERSQTLLSVCPDKGYHRRYRFEFPKRALVSKETSGALVTALWCNESAARTVKADLDVSAIMLRFRFRYPWATLTGKYPKTEFRLNRNKGTGGFFDDLTWTCRPEQRPEDF